MKQLIGSQKAALQKEPKDITYFVNPVCFSIGEILEKLNRHQQRVEIKIKETVASDKAKGIFNSNELAHAVYERISLKRHIRQAMHLFFWLNGYDYNSEKEVLERGFRMFLENRELILNDAVFYNARSDQFRFSVGPCGTTLSIGFLFSLWQDGKFLENCPVCGKVCYVISACGGLSGTGNWRTFCPTCNDFISANNTRGGRSPHSTCMGYLMNKNPKPRFPRLDHPYTLLQLYQDLKNKKALLL